MRALLDALAVRRVRRIVLHASDDGRSLYERLGFVPTNEVRLSEDTPLEQRDAGHRSDIASLCRRMESA